MNDLDLCLEVVSRSCEQLRYIRLWISRKPLEIEAWFQRTTNRKLHMGYQMVTWPMASRTPKVLWGSTVGYPSDSLASCYCFVLKCKTHHIGMVDADFFSSKRNSLTRNRLNRTTTVLSLSLSLSDSFHSLESGASVTARLHTTMTTGQVYTIIHVRFRSTPNGVYLCRCVCVIKAGYWLVSWPGMLR